MNTKTASIILARLKIEYPDVRVALRYRNPLELLVSTVLSAQCTDKRVNMVTPALFKKYKTARDYATADLGSFEQEIRSTGFYHAKARNIRAAAQMIVKKFGGKVPKTMEELIQLPGVARKTANIVLSSGFGIIEGIAVDTHCKRLAQRLGISKQGDPVKIEQDMMKLFPKKDWADISLLLIAHGRAVCGAKKPQHDKCVLRNICPSRNI